jgi:hypothetical protein
MRFEWFDIYTEISTFPLMGVLLCGDNSVAGRAQHFRLPVYDGLSNANLPRLVALIKQRDIVL